MCHWSRSWDICDTVIQISFADRRVGEDSVSAPAMSGRQLLPRLLLRTSRLASANTAHRIAHPPAPCIDATRAFLLNRYGLASSASWSGSRSLCTRSLFPSSASMLAPGFRNEVNWTTREVGCTTAGLTHVRYKPETLPWRSFSLSRSRFASWQRGSMVWRRGAVFHFSVLGVFSWAVHVFHMLINKEIGMK